MTHLKTLPRTVLFAVWLGLLAACGGSQLEERSAAAGRAAPLANEAPTGTSPGAATAPEVATALSEAARLNAETLQAADREASSNPALTAARKSGALAKALSRVPVHRFYNSQTAAHFYTIAEAERASVAATLPQFQYEGVAFSVSEVAAPSLSPVYRFFNSQTGVHFYSISAEERAHIQQTLPQFNYEGVAYYASQVSGQGLMPLYRFYQTQRGFHFYSASSQERDSIIANLPNVYTYEGIGYYVMSESWNPPQPVVTLLPHSGVTNQQCYRAGSNILVACGEVGAINLNNQQDGHRSAVNSMSYSELPKAGGGNYSRTECIKDNVTGLIWEGKMASGVRSGANTYTHYDDPTKRQKWTGQAYVEPTQSEIEAMTNSVGYRNYVNSIALCGYSDWRIPAVDELNSIVDYSKIRYTPKINSTWFVNTPIFTYSDVSMHRSSTTADGVRAWSVNFQYGNALQSLNRSDQQAVRLVRGDTADLQACGSSWQYSPHGTEVVDLKHRLAWQRCSVGQTWNGSTCTGQIQYFSHESALVYSRTQAGAVGWRLPNVKELFSLVDKGCSNPSIDSALFPATQAAEYWSSTPSVDQPSDAWFVTFYGGYTNSYFGRTGQYAIRLIRSIN